MGKLSRYILLLLFYLGGINMLSGQYIHYDRDSVKINRCYIINDDEVVIQNKSKILVECTLWDTNRIGVIIVPITDSTAEKFTYSYNKVLVSKNKLKLIKGKYFEDGLRYSFNEDGSISQMYTYQNGKKNGACISYFKNGLIEIKGAYKNGEETGIWLYYNEQGKLIKKVNHGN